CPRAARVPQVTRPTWPVPITTTRTFPPLLSPVEELVHGRRTATFLGSRQARQLETQPQQEPRVQDRVPLPEPAWLEDQSMEPFESGPPNQRMGLKQHHCQVAAR